MGKKDKIISVPIEVIEKVREDIEGNGLKVYQIETFA